MQTRQHYMLTINDLLTMSDGVILGADAEVAILDGSVEIDRLKFSGKVGPGGPGFRKSYEGKPGLKAELVSGCCRVSFRKVMSRGVNSEV